MQFKIIVAVCKNNGIGYKQTLPWKIKEDLKHFSTTTKGSGNNAIVMGKNTWLSIGGNPLPKRDNLLLSKSLYSEISGSEPEMVYRSYKGGKVFDSIDGLKEWCREKKYNEIWIIGGESIYKQFINDPDTKEIVITEVDELFECDTFFPEFSLDSTWNEISRKQITTTQQFNISVIRYVR